MREYIRFVLRTVLAVTVSVFFFVGCSENKNVEKILVFADSPWASVQIHNRIASFIVENGIGGYKGEYVQGGTLENVNRVIAGDIDIVMESWHSNFWDVYKKGIATDKILDLGQTMPDAPQGWWFPLYMIEGSDAMAPDLRTVDDLYKYSRLFQSPGNPGKGILYAGVEGWAANTFSEKLFYRNNLDAYFERKILDTGGALRTSLIEAYKARKPWIGYYWAPTDIIGLYDMVLLSGTEYEPSLIHKLVNKERSKRFPEVKKFLENYYTTLEMNNEFLAVKGQNNLDEEQTAIWFLENRSDVWESWVSEEVAEKVKAALESLN